MRYKQAGRGGIGTVFRDKKIKALVVKFSEMKGDLNSPADPKLLQETGRKVNDEMRRLDPIQNDMAGVGTAHLVSIMNDYDLLPTHNFKYGPILRRTRSRPMCTESCSHPMASAMAAGTAAPWPAPRALMV